MLSRVGVAVAGLINTKANLSLFLGFGWGLGLSLTIQVIFELNFSLELHFLQSKFIQKTIAWKAQTSIIMISFNISERHHPTDSLHSGEVFILLHQNLIIDVLVSYARILFLFLQLF